MKSTDPMNPDKITGYQKLEKLHGLFVKQLIINAGCCDLENNYTAYPANEFGEKRGTRLFNAKVQQGCLSSMCLPYANSLSIANTFLVVTANHLRSRSLTL